MGTLWLTSPCPRLVSELSCGPPSPPFCPMILFPHPKLIFALLRYSFHSCGTPIKVCPFSLRVVSISCTLLTGTLSAAGEFGNHFGVLQWAEEIIN